MIDYERGFVEGLQAVCMMIEKKWDFHFKNAEDKNIPEEDRESALNCACVLGQLGSDVKGLGSQVHRKQIDPSKIAKAEANGGPFWWATEDGKGRN